MKLNKAKRAVVIGLDGADPLLVEKLIDQGKLPNIKRFKELGVTTENMSMFGVHPTITPPNWASLATGAYPGTHGLTCFWNHNQGDDLTKLRHGFNSELCEAEYIWDAASKKNKKTIIFNYPTGFPPTSSDNLIVIDGTGINVNGRSLADHERMYECIRGEFSIIEIPYDIDSTGIACSTVKQSETTKNFEIAASSPGGRKTRNLAEKRIETAAQKKIDICKTPIKVSSGWKFEKLDALEISLPVNGGKEYRFGLLLCNDGVYDTLEIYSDKDDNNPLGCIRVGQWSDWIYDTFKTDNEVIKVAYKLKLLELAEDGSKLKLYYNAPVNLDDDNWFYPKNIGKEIYNAVGPMVYQSYSADDYLMLEVMEQLYDWYGKAVQYLANNHEWDLLYLHVHALDSANHNYANKILEEHGGDYNYFKEILTNYYQISDNFVGQILELFNDETLMFIVSDHGGMSKEAGCETPLIGDPWDVGGKLLEDLSYLVVKNGESNPEIDWEKTKAIGQRSGYVYVNLKGREPHGSVYPEEYDQLVEKIIDDLLTYKDPKNGRRPFALALRKEDMPILGLYGEHVGDIYFTFNPSWARVHGTSLTTSTYKGTSVGCLFMMAGAGVKKNTVINRKVKIVDIVPTISYLMGIPAPKHTEGAIIYQGLEE